MTHIEDFINDFIKSIPFEITEEDIDKFADEFLKETQKKYFPTMATDFGITYSHSSYLTVGNIEEEPAPEEDIFKMLPVLHRFPRDLL